VTSDFGILNNTTYWQPLSSEIAVRQACKSRFLLHRSSRRRAPGGGEPNRHLPIGISTLQVLPAASSLTGMPNAISNLKKKKGVDAWACSHAISWHAFRATCESERNGVTSTPNQVNRKLTNTICSTFQGSFTIRAVPNELKS